MKSLILIALILALTTAFPFVNKKQVEQIPSPDYPQCAYDAVKFVQDSYNFVEYIQKNGDQNIQEILTQVKELLTDAQNLIKDCDIPVNPDYFTPSNSTECVSQVQAFTDLLSEALANKNDLPQLIEYAQKLLAQGAVTVQNCKSPLIPTKAAQVPLDISINSLECTQQALIFQQSALKFYNSLSALPLQQNGQVFIQGVNDLTADAQNLITACGGKVNLADYTPLNNGACLGDILRLGQIAIQAVQDAIKLNIQALVVDAIGIVAEGARTVVDCLSFSEEQAQNSKMIQCASSYQSFSANIQVAYTDTMSSNMQINQVISDAKTVSDYFPTFLKTCGANKQAEMYQNSIMVACEQALEDAAINGQKLYNANSNVIAVAKSMPGFIVSMQNVKKTCQFQKN